MAKLEQFKICLQFFIHEPLSDHKIDEKAVVFEIEYLLKLLGQFPQNKFCWF